MTQALRDLYREISDDNVGNGAAALAYYLMLAIFPMAIFALSLLPYLHIPNLEQAIMDGLRQALPGDAAEMFTGTVQSVVSRRNGGLLSFGLLATLWAASNGMSAIMSQLNITYDVKDTRPFWRKRAIALLLVLLFTILVGGGFALIVFGAIVQGWIGAALGWSAVLATIVKAFHAAIVVGLLLLGFALIYYLGPDVEQRFRFVSPGSVMGVVLLGAASFGFRLYVTHFGNYNATYGGLGAVIILLFWLYLAGWVLLIGSEINALIESYTPTGKPTGSKQAAARERAPRPRPQPAPRGGSEPSPA